MQEIKREDFPNVTKKDRRVHVFYKEFCESKILNNEKILAMEKNIKVME